MNLKTIYRKGAIGALMDEYERAAEELKNLVGNISETDFTKIVDAETKDDDCRSVQTIVSHVINSGYGYANYIRQWYDIPQNSPARRLYLQTEFSNELKKMLIYSVETLQDKLELSDDEIMKVKIISHHGPTYDIEQMLEHAIVHILRHRRQIEKFISSKAVNLK